MPNSNFRSATIFRNYNYDYNSRWRWLYEGRYSKRRLEEWGLHDEIDSVAMDPGVTVRLYKDNWWQGECRELVQNTPSLGSAWHDSVSSILVIDDRMTPRVRVFAKPDFHDDCTDHHAEDEDDGFCDQIAHGVGDNAVSSVMVPDGLMAIMCEHSDGSGRVIGLVEDMRDMGLYNFDNATSSMYVYAESTFAPELKSGSIPDPPELTGFDTSVLPDPPAVVVAEALMPFMYVTDAELPPYIQAKRSPYYRLTREAGWMRAFDFADNGAAPAPTLTWVLEVGLSEEAKWHLTQIWSNETTHEAGATLKVKVGEWLEIGGKYDYKTTEKYSKELGVSTTKIIKSTETYRFETSFNSTGPCAGIVWVLQNTYTLSRWDDGHIVAKWSVLDETVRRTVQWPKGTQVFHTISLISPP